MDLLLSDVSFSDAHVSAPSTLPPTAPVQMLCARPHANIRFHYRLLPLTRSLASLVPPFPRSISAWDGRAAKLKDGSIQRIDYIYGFLRQSRDSRAWPSAQDASGGAVLTHTRVRAVLVLAPSRLAQRSSGLSCCRHRGPAFRGRRRGRLAHVRSQ